MEDWQTANQESMKGLGGFIAACGRLQGELKGVEGLAKEVRELRKAVEARKGGA